MREIRIDFTAENMLPDGCDIGLIGEHNATDLVITPPAEMAECEEITSYTAAFVTEGKIIRSDLYEKAETITVSLCSQLTQDHTLGVQLEGYDGEGGLVVKSKLITGLRLLPSAGGDETDFVSGASGIVSQINANTLARHSHENTSVLDKLGETDGNLTFDGVAVTAGKTKTLEFNLEKYGFVATADYDTLQFYATDNPDGTSPVPEGADVISVEMNTSIEGMPEWVNIREMIRYDYTAPYSILPVLTYHEPDTDRTLLASISFIHNTNDFFDAAKFDMIHNIRVTFSDKGSD